MAYETVASFFGQLIVTIKRVANKSVLIDFMVIYTEC